jgi:hypothetical protein
MTLAGVKSQLDSCVYRRRERLIHERTKATTKTTMNK